MGLNITSVLRRALALRQRHVGVEAFEARVDRRLLRPRPGDRRENEQTDRAQTDGWGVVHHAPDYFRHAALVKGWNGNQPWASLTAVATRWFQTKLQAVLATRVGDCEVRQAEILQLAHYIPPMRGLEVNGEDLDAGGQLSDFHLRQLRRQMSGGCGPRAKIIGKRDTHEHGFQTRV